MKLNGKIISTRAMLCMEETFCINANWILFMPRIGGLVEVQDCLVMLNRDENFDG